MASYYVPLPQQQFPQNALLDFSPIQRAQALRQNMENLAYERARQNTMDQRALENQIFERNRQATQDERNFKHQQFEEGVTGSNLRLNQARDAREAAKFGLPDYKQDAMGNWMAFSPTDPYGAPKIVYKTPSMDEQIRSRGYGPDNALIPPANNSASQSPFRYFSTPTDTGSFFEAPTMRRVVQPMDGMSVDTSTVLQQTKQPKTNKLTVNSKGYDYTEDDIVDLTNSPNPADQRKAKFLQERMDELRKKSGFETPTQQIAAANTLQDNVNKLLDRDYRPAKRAWNEINNAAKVYDDPSISDAEKGVSDLALVKSYLKLIDPTARFNPNDAETLVNAPSAVLEAVQFLRSISKAGSLSPSMRDYIINRANETFRNITKEARDKLLPSQNLGDTVNVPRNQYYNENEFPSEDQFPQPRRTQKTITDPNKFSVIAEEPHDNNDLVRQLQSQPSMF